MTLILIRNPHLLADIDGEFEGWCYTMRFSSHYYTQGDKTTHWKCYAIHYHGADFQREGGPVPDAHVLQAVKKRASLVIIDLTRNYPPDEVNT